MKKIAVLLLSLVLLLVVLVIAVSIVVIVGGNEYDDLIFKNIVLEDNVFTADVFFTGASGKTFRGYKYKIDGENLYLTIKSGLAVKNIGTGNLRVEIQDTQLNSVKNVYVKKGKQTKVIMNK